jgi:hypothetical protein
MSENKPTLYAYTVQDRGPSRDKRGAKAGHGRDGPKNKSARENDGRDAHQSRSRKTPDRSRTAASSRFRHQQRTARRWARLR